MIFIHSQQKEKKNSQLTKIFWFLPISSFYLSRDNYNLHFEIKKYFLKKSDFFIFSTTEEQQSTQNSSHHLCLLTAHLAQNCKCH